MLRSHIIILTGIVDHFLAKCSGYILTGIEITVDNFLANVLVTHPTLL